MNVQALRQVPAPLAALVALAAVAKAEVYECKNEDGCIAKRGPAGAMEEVRFAEGDLISSAGNWVVPPDQGWEIFED